MEAPTHESFRFFPPLWFDEVASTSDLLKMRLAGEVKPVPGLVIAARRQTRGRGRMGSEWHSSREGDLTFSFYFESRRPPAVTATLPMACALAVRDFLVRPPLAIGTLCKWPNDVMADNAKICGILTEATPSSPGGMGLVVGIGINVRRMAGRDEKLGRPTAAVEHFHAAVEDPEILLPQVLDCLSVRLSSWLGGGFPGIREDLLACQWGIGRQVTAKIPGGVVAGVVEGLGDNGELLLRDEEGKRRAVASVAALDGWDIPAV